MPTTFGMVMMAVLVLLAVAGVVLWIRKTQARREDLPRPSGREAPLSPESAASLDSRRGSIGGSGT